MFFIAVFYKNQKIFLLVVTSACWFYFHIFSPVGKIWQKPPSETPENTESEEAKPEPQAEPELEKESPAEDEAVEEPEEEPTKYSDTDRRR